jgi:hypothetical protein
MVLSVMVGVGGRRGRITDTCYRNVRDSVKFPVTRKGAPVGSDAPRHELGGAKQRLFAAGALTDRLNTGSKKKAPRMACTGP